jgi:hypothetical protein
MASDPKVRFVYELGDGHVEVTDETLVPMGTAYTFRQLTYRAEGLRVVFEVNDDGVPGCVSISLQARHRPIRQKDLASIKLDQLRDNCFLVVGMIIPPSAEDAHDSFAVGGDQAYKIIRRNINRATSRRKVTPQFLRQVAKVYRGAVDGDRAESVSAAFGVTERQAWRYIAQAKESGYIK